MSHIQLYLTFSIGKQPNMIYIECCHYLMRTIISNNNTVIEFKYYYM